MIFTVLGKNPHFPLLSPESLPAPEHVNGMVQAEEKLLLGISANTTQIYHHEKSNIYQKINKNTLRVHFPPSPCQSWKGSPVFETWFKWISSWFLAWNFMWFLLIKSILNRKPRFSVLTLKIYLCFIELQLQAWYTHERYFLKPVMRL